jgi:chromate transport protein ChrA
VGSLGWFFFKAGAFTFGSGLAIVPFLHQGLVTEHDWLTQQQFVDAVAMGLITPGPVVIMATFAGYLAYGLVGAIVATVGVFLPALLLVIVPGPFIRRHEQHPRLQGFVKGATAAAAGAIAGAAIVIAGQILLDATAAVLALIALTVLLQRIVRVPEPALVIAAALVGLPGVRVTRAHRRRARRRRHARAARQASAACLATGRSTTARWRRTGRWPPVPGRLCAGRAGGWAAGGQRAGRRRRSRRGR